jgi:hypothetical protein
LRKGDYKIDKSIDFIIVGGPFINTEKEIGFEFITGNF